MKTALFALAVAALAGIASAQEAPPPPPGGGGMLRADTDGDGVVTREEAIAQATQRFDRMDVNHDDRLTRDELDRGGRWMRGPRDGGGMEERPIAP